jgi:hypothetical protein
MVSPVYMGESRTELTRVGTNGPLNSSVSRTITLRQCYTALNEPATGCSSFVFLLHRRTLRGRHHRHLVGVLPAGDRDIV